MATSLTSSTSGVVALVASLVSLYMLPMSTSKLFLIAHQGSGSACCSLFGGFVAWEMGSAPDGLDSIAIEIAPHEHWPDIHMLIYVISDDKKGTSSTLGIQCTIKTSLLLQHHIMHVIPTHMAAIKEAISQRDFPSFVCITMQDLNQFHTDALDTNPPIFYLNDVLYTFIIVITEYNHAMSTIKATYTFDAGLNSIIYPPKENIKETVEHLL